MNSEELAKLVPWIVAEKLEDATSPTPVMPGPMHDEAPAWSFRCGPVLTVASIHPDENELRLTLGLAINIPYTTDVSHHVNRFNHHDLVFGRAFLIGNEESGRGAVLMQEIMFGDSLSWEFPPSLQNLLRVIGTLSARQRASRQSFSHATALGR